MKAEIRMMCPEAKEHQAPPEGRKRRVICQNCKRQYDHGSLQFQIYQVQNDARINFRNFYYDKM